MASQRKLWSQSRRSKICFDRFHVAKLLNDAQRSAEGFYRRLGFEGQGEPYEEAGIPHLTMRRALNGPRA